MAKLNTSRRLTNSNNVVIVLLANYLSLAIGKITFLIITLPQSYQWNIIIGFFEKIP